MMKTIAIIGGGLAGVSGARALRDEGYDGRLLLIGEEAHRPYDRPSLSKAVLAGDEERPAELVERTWLEDGDVEFLPGRKVMGLDLPGRRLELGNGEAIGVDGVLLAMGARPRRLGIPGSDLAGVHYLRTVDDSLAMRAKLKPGMHVAIVGGGLIGCEVATTARKLGAEVTIVEAADELLLRVLGPSLGAWCRRRLEELGIRVLLNTKTVRFAGREGVEAIVTDANERLPADFVLVSIGAEPATDLAEAAGLACQGGVIVDGTGATASSGVYAAGDIAAWPLRDGRRRSFETYQNAQSQAVAAARAILGRGAASPQIPVSWTEMAGHRIQMVGDLAGGGELVTRVDPQAGAHLVFRIADGRVVAAASIDAARDFATARRLVEMEASVPRRSLSDLNIELRTLARATAGA